jgi:hypothetical protein
MERFRIAQDCAPVLQDSGKCLVASGECVSLATIQCSPLCELSTFIEIIVNDRYQGICGLRTVLLGVGEDHVRIALGREFVRGDHLDRHRWLD